MPLNISSNAKGILFIIAAVSCLSVMDGVTRYLTDYYNVIEINMFRYFFLFIFVISIYGILFKILRIDLLRLKKQSNSYWLESESSNDVRKMF